MNRLNPSSVDKVMAIFLELCRFNRNGYTCIL